MIKSSKTFILSDETPNMFDFSVDTEGIDLEDFLINPVLLYNHDYTKLLGQWTDVRKEGKNLLGVPMFDEEDDEAMKYYSKVQQGMLKAASIGFTPVEFDEVNKKMVKSSLKEGTITPVGANRKAVTVYDNNGKKLSANEVKEICLSLQPVSEQQLQQQSQKMNEKLIAALIVLSAQAGLTINLSATSKEDEVADAIKGVGEKIATLKTKNTELSGKVETLETAAKDAVKKEHADLLKKAVDDKLLSAEKADELKVLDLPILKTVLSAMTPVTVKTVGKTTETTASDAAMDATKEAWTYDDFALKAPQELESMQITNPDKFEKLLSAKTKQSRQIYSIEL